MVYNPRQVYKYRKRFKYKLKYKLGVKNKSFRLNAASIAIKSLTLSWMEPKIMQKLHLKIKQKFKYLKKKRILPRRKCRRFSRKKIKKTRKKNRFERLGYMTSHLFAFCPVTRKSKLVRMGKGKGKFIGWKAPVFVGSILFQVRRRGLLSKIKNLKLMFNFGKIKGRFSGRLNLIIVRNIY